MKQDIIFDSRIEESKEAGIQHSYRGNFAQADIDLTLATIGLGSAEANVDKLHLGALLRERALNALRAHATGGGHRRAASYREAFDFATQATQLVAGVEGSFANSLTYRTEAGKASSAMGRLATAGEDRTEAQRLYRVAHGQLRQGSDSQATAHNALLASREARIDGRRFNSLGWLAVATWHAAKGILTADSSTRRAEDVFMARVSDVITKKRAMRSVTNPKKTADGNIVNA